MQERTFVMLKPDAVERGLVGEILRVFENAGLKIVALKMLRPHRGLAAALYPDSEEWLANVGSKALEGYRLVGLDTNAELETSDTVEIGKTVKGWLVEFLTSGEVVAMVLEGNAAVRNVRRLCGDTLPIRAEPGSIRGRFGVDSPDLAMSERRPVHNLVHASSDEDEAQREIALWFPKVGGKCEAGK